MTKSQTRRTKNTRRTRIKQRPYKTRQKRTLSNNTKNKNKKKIIVQSLWVGSRLSRMENYSIKSFLVLGYEYHLYTYEKVKNVPKGVKLKNGNDIMPKNEIFNMKSTYLPFSDIWRYKMLYEKGNYWVDLDMIAIKPFDFKEEYVFSSERTIQEGAYKSAAPLVPNIGILKAPKGSEFFLEAYNKCLEFNNKNKNDDKLKYMKMLRKLIIQRNMGKWVKEPKLFCNLDWWHAREAFEVHDRYKRKYGVIAPTINSHFSGPYTVHFWRDRVTKKYKLDLDKVYDPKCLWEMMLAKVDNYD
jgi:hypothetical protein